MTFLVLHVLRRTPQYSQSCKHRYRLYKCFNLNIDRHIHLQSLFLLANHPQSIQMHEVVALATTLVTQYQHSSELMYFHKNTQVQ